MPLQKLALVLGGAASGKSAYAESLVAALDRSKVYLATAEAWDIEMQAKIDRHKERRDAGWRTVETPRDAAEILRDIPPTEAVLLDCATLWLTNHMLADADLNAEEDRLLQALGDCRAPVVVVSNEIGLGLVPDNALGRRFRDAQGRLNQRLAAQADLVVFVAAGLPLVLKGTLA
ncbi:bifunctional adenosylcobinamide kinase/adenosylcobinamide-phosphate guanylyltransferase [Rubellimicrobium rubrum]|uniref:Bifunctional adenosylcobalamin biosynthesis protein n=1 Tax=Rubellimicrobium rubrum TaxID=2585369 RepID=A0A5C4N6B0_9RHOB|nr:bifunctional adenosylcobinamide kinase/adenosylcobinamide-phosphate guanylyltransferase [Rubellimicrobium rubrum]TNC51901.1 bifunctional adenosylcobinamide kinase/adenosylcobinamide-phosphate guanylyltransferase [Rubellimicrobium rubrum]